MTLTLIGCGGDDDDEVALSATLANKTLHVDPNKFAVVIRNLVSNALKFTPRGGTVTVTVEVIPNPPPEPSVFPVSSASSDATRVHPEERVSIGRLRLLVTDTGAGISKVCCVHFLFFLSVCPLTD